MAVTHSPPIASSVTPDSHRRARAGHWNTMQPKVIDNSRRLKLAVQKSGRLTDPSLELLKNCGLKLSRGRDQLMGFGENMPLDVLFVRDDDIPDLVQEDVCDLGLVGRNVLEEKRLELISRGQPAKFTELRTLEYGRCRLSLAIPDGFTYEGASSLAGKRIATTYPFTLGKYLRDRNVSADIVTLSGAVEIAPRLGRADLICDLVSTGSTLQANHLREVDVVLESKSLLIRTPVDLHPDKQEWVDRLLLRIDGVQQVRESKYIMLHAPRSALPEIRRLLPGSESPTILPLDGSDDRVAIHAVCRENVFWETLESLKKAGASSLLVLPVEKMLA
jgi:ATP phosphoribosyltransferase